MQKDTSCKNSNKLLLDFIARHEPRCPTFEYFMQFYIRLPNVNVKRHKMARVSCANIKTPKNENFTIYKGIGTVG